MSTRLASAKIVRVTTTETRDIVSVGGRKATVAQTGEYVVERPNHFYAKMTGGRNLESWYNGKTLTIASHNEKVFAQAPMPDTIDRTLDALAERYDMPLPMGDLFYGSPEKALISATTTLGYAGTEDVGGTPCVHLAFHDVGVDWELRLPTQGDPLPKRFKGRPEITDGPAGQSISPSRRGSSRRRSAKPPSLRRCRQTMRASPSCSARRP